MPGYYHPTFLYESLWCVGVALLVIWADRRLKLGHGRAFALYVAAYCAGRFWIEYMRVDDAHHFLGLRLNNWTALFVFLLAVVYIVVSAKKRPGREGAVEPGAQPSDGRHEEAKSVEAGDGPGGEEGRDRREHRYGQGRRQTGARGRDVREGRGTGGQGGHEAAAGETESARKS
ncbi:Phosphatidylglycerol--prolipoprotein diacylglyceryl transferase [Streptomyces violaceorubidus]